MPRHPAAPKTSPSADAGFTMVEVLVAMVIMAVSLLGLLEVIGTSTVSNVKNQLRDDAVLIGEAQMAELIRLPQSALVPVQTLTVPGRMRGGDKPYAVTREAQRLSTSDSYQFIVKVKWAYKNVTSFHEVRTVRSYKDGK
ncbi:type IV pilus modification PilV family protein [Geomonas anaerohicana]|uniref:Prepilin-type N-terminal cleavage/methylation domain-containing protein n=1 Tax=Geomonas anaerohicana TaxID=2798583 RepID=A0ABS0Y9N1_9BACT|nr:prepilin-type N-terminal cleavage/methylation domain-containing protein [Geomonas anaerohicana]MBJ6749005.1 prepilin-type N-terminal cleavage/methylation domain-containing protein [Geomonas anaerohicana]